MKPARTSVYPRDMAGYGRNPPAADWPGGARLALQIVLNYEEGAERSILHGDDESETINSEIVGAAAFRDARHMSMESMYEYGSRAGYWRLMRLFDERRIPITVFGVAMAMERNPDAVAAMVEGGHEIACHGWRWIDYQFVDPDTERVHLRAAVESMRRMTGVAPLGWYTGRASPDTRRLVVEHGGFLYDADSYADDLPYWVRVSGAAHLVVPYAFDTNDMRFAMANGFNTGEEFYAYLRDTFDVFYAEGATRPAMMSVGLHCRLLGRPGRFAGLLRFLDYVQRHDGVWICRRIDIARHWLAYHPAAEECPA